ncbi:hypothetical protein T484DRAFT_1976402 [Baffinella frigidus]|nr:hypothetical protein T484DRAFT_1976402 [Cryptophyta sp. CCMP2293]
MSSPTMGTSPIPEDQCWSSPTFKLKEELRKGMYEEDGIEQCDFFRRSDSTFDFARLRSTSSSSAEEQELELGPRNTGSPGRWPSLPEWPELDPAAFERGKALLGSMEMDPTCFSRDDLCHLALEIFEATGLPDELAADVGRVRRFILAIRERMFPNAYHNFYHVFDVTQTVSVIARRTGTLDRLNAWERFALLAAAFCHDLEHPGVSSVFLDHAGPSVAGAFKDTVLERHHVIRAFEVMVRQDIGLLKGLSSESYWDFRNAVAGCILATDFAKHSSYSEQVRELVQEGASRPAIQLEMELIIKCADISNVLKPFPIARRWALRVTDEFFAQGDVERARGMHVTPFCDRRTASRVGLQVGFIDAVCAPFFDAMATLYPGLGIDVERMHANRQRWASYSDTDLEAFRRAQHVSQHPPPRLVTCPTEAHNLPISHESADHAGGGSPGQLTPGLQGMLFPLFPLFPDAGGAPHNL